MSEYPLEGVVRYFRRRTATALLFGMFRHISEQEKAGNKLEFAMTYFTGDAHVGVTFLSRKDKPGEHISPAADA
jgi:hypothetical protein